MLMSSKIEEEIKMEKIYITDPKTETRIELQEYLKQENLLLDESKYPFTIDHSKCLSCQREKGNPHLCSSCQWELSGVGDNIKRNQRAKSQLRDIEFILDNLMRKSFYFEETTIKDAIDLVETEINESEYTDDKTKLIIQLERIKQLDKLGLDWNSGY